MTELYILNLKDRLNNPIDDYLHLFTPERRDKILRHKHKSDQNRTLWAEILARNVIAIKTNQNIESIRIMRDSNGRPYVLPEYNLEFSISHSGNYAALSIGNHANGIDIERMSRANHEIAEHFFTHEERMILETLNEEDFAKKFLCYWTLKESYAKCTGIELMNVIRNMNCENIPGKNFFIDEYVIGVCGDDLPDVIHEIKIPPALLIPAGKNFLR